jgi:hypothetical protein
MLGSMNLSRPLQGQSFNCVHFSAERRAGLSDATVLAARTPERLRRNS